MRILDKPGLTFDDVLLMPAKGYVNSRNPDSVDIDIGVQLTPRNFKMRYPIISANMDTITGKEMADEMSRLGGLGIVHRFMSFEEQAMTIGQNKKTVVCIGAVEAERERLCYLLHTRSPDIGAVLIDTAHGHSQMMVKQVEWVKQTHPGVDIIAGNVCTADAALALIRAGATCVKVGVGPGSMCTTRIQTGNGVPQLTAIMDVRRGIEKVFAQQRGERWRPTIIADGGIRNSGDMVKALAAGADAIMTGYLFAGCSETPTLPGKHDDMYSGPERKRYRGMASREFQEDWKGKVTSVEGESTIVPSKGPTSKVFQELVEGILSGMSYQGADTLEDLFVNAEFILQSPAGYREATPHGLK